MSAEPSGGPADVSCPSKANEGTPEPKTSDLEEYGLEYRQSKWDWILPGLGDPGDDCGVNKVVEANSICPNGDSIRYEPLRCRRVECPDCYKTEQLERLFRVVLEIEARAIVRGERPHAVTFSVPPSEARTWTYDRLNESLFRRGYRRMRSVGIDGGYAVFHPWRIQDPRKDALERRGYGPGGNKGGYWNGVRDDVLDLGDPRRYAKFGPHGHNIGFPGRIDPHEGDDYVVQKYDELENLESVLRHVRYLLTHRGVRTEETGRSVRPWGAFHHASNDWNGAENELPEEQYHSLAETIAGMIGMEWDPEEETVVPETTEECPECGESVEEFHDLTDVIGLVSGRGPGRPWTDTLEADQRSFFDDLAHELRKAWDDPERNGLNIDDLDPPDSVTPFSTEGDRPPP